MRAPALLPSLRGFRRSWLRADLVAGVAAGCVVIPQAMAYATIADMPVEVGLYTCMVPMVVYAVLGGSHVMSVSTTSTVALLCATTLAAAGLGTGTVNAIADLTTLVLLVAVVLLVFRVLHLGTLVDNISVSVLTGVKAGVGLTVAADQLPKLLGIAPDPDAGGFFETLGSALSHLGDANGATVVLSAVTIAGLLLLRRLAPRVPAPLVAVAGGILAVAVLGIDGDGVALIPEVPSGLPAPALPAFDRVGRLVPGALAIALMVVLESLSVARAVRTRDEPAIDNDQELAAAGAASLAGAFFQAMPAAGGFSQTAVNQQSGARSQLSGLTTAVLAVLAALFLAPVLDDLPEATLGALVIVATLGLVSVPDFLRLARINRVELAVAAVTAAVGLVAGLLAAVALGVALTLALVLRELDRPDLFELHPEGAPPGLLALRVGAPLYTANVRAIQRDVLALVDAAIAAGRAPAVVVLDVTVQGVVSVTVLDATQELDRELADRDVMLWLAALPPRAVEVARRTHWWPEWEGAGRVHPTVDAAVGRFRADAPAPAPGSGEGPDQL